VNPATPPPRERIDIARFLDDVHAHVSLVDLVSQHVPLRRMGRSYRAACPFHPNAKNPNFDVNPTRNTYHCYVCGKTGTAIRFVQEHSAFPVHTFIEAIRYLAERAGIPVPLTSGFDAAAEAKARSEREVLAEVLSVADQVYAEAAAVPEYADASAAACVGQGIAPTLIARANGGFVPDVAHQVFIKHLVHEDLDATWWDACRRLGLLTFDGPPESDTASETVQDALPSGIVWPLRQYGRVVGLTLRGPAGEEVASTRAVSTLNPGAGALIVHATTGESSPDVAGAPVGIFANYADWLALGAAWPHAAIVPMRPWDTLTTIRSVRAHVGHRTPLGIIGPTGTTLFWCHEERISWIRQVGAPSEPIWSYLHACDRARCEDPDLDLSDLFPRVTDDRVRMVLEGWWARETGQARPVVAEASE
jgi:hypothetical protein